MDSALNEPAAARPSLRQRLRHVYWVGGGSGSGKSTIARRLGDHYGMQVYETDAVMPDHARRLTADAAPYLAAFAAMDMDDRWVNRTPKEMLDTFHWYHGEGFDEIVQDLIQFPADRPVIAEGFRLLPGLVKPLLTDRSHAVWLLPTREFRRTVFDTRGGTAWGFIAKTGNPERALQNLLDRDDLFTERLADQTRELNLIAITVDAAVTEDDLVRQVAATFGLDGSLGGPSS